MKFMAISALLFWASISAFAAPRPIMKATDPEVLGRYQLHNPQDGCEDGGRGICDAAKIVGKGRKLSIEFSNGNYSIPLTQKKNVLTFSQDYQEDCDNPGCSNLEKIFGTVYFKKFGRIWVRMIKVNTIVDFPYPESEDDREGQISSTAYLTK